MKYLLKKRLWFLVLISSTLLFSLVTLYPTWLTHVPPQVYGKKKFGWLQPNVYKVGDNVDLLVNKAISTLNADLKPYIYHDLPFVCPPTSVRKPVHLEFDSLFRGDTLSESDYKLKFGDDYECEILCARKTNKNGVSKAIDMIKQDYQILWSIDDELPISMPYISTITQRKKYIPGFPLGRFDKDKNKVYLYNHSMLVIRYNAIDDDKFTIVGFEVYLRSVSDYHCPGASKNYEEYELVIPENDDDLTFIPFTYSVYWREEFDIDWTSRWNLFDNDIEEEDPKLINKSMLSNIMQPTRTGLFLLPLIIFSIIIVKVVENGEKNKFTTEAQLASKCWIESNNINLKSSFSASILTLVISMGVQSIFSLIGIIILKLSIYKLHDISNIVLLNIFIWFIEGILASSFLGTWLRMNILNKKSINYNPKFSILCGSLLPFLLMIFVYPIHSIVWLIESSSRYPFKTLTMMISFFYIICVPFSIIGGGLAKKYRKHYKEMFGNITLDNENNDNDEKKRFKAQHRPSSINKNKLGTLVYSLITAIVPFFIIKSELYWIFTNKWLNYTTFIKSFIFLIIKLFIIIITVSSTSLVGLFVNIMMTKKGISQWRDDPISLRWSCFLNSFNICYLTGLYSLYYIIEVIRIHGFSMTVLTIFYTIALNVILGISCGAIAYMTCYWLIIKLYKNTN
ncbi:hypothetical protein Kpol_1045p28 [Vanderwaltozyma polyspora DSM 70294]|uniref:Transmembrane 9 superfamily member n=1 Tax=Vanderwaltozyma polyspora (strain ATCC 22028 / DSM 70294 / BCRC 21397 / CBS 2163 / NBRC 10782 / NRRL Y-8283 / UCD 57-17) TaxID=436907 RepID=A7TI35_VANPO|nr:uncharacterized protein Kpol_1045p28 [Vanderwaltozyma polyspora DSM 70294]EDO18042.1 hypothetical protein Kpol_1045p28 [Vanderwaltozyma polyspora DSM 70294]